MNITTKTIKSQQSTVVFQENLPIECSEVIEKFQPKKIEAAKVSRLFYLLAQSEKLHQREKLFENFGSRTASCSHFLSFGQNILSDGSLSDKALKTALFCHVRFCPLCSWRKSVKLFAQLAKASALIVNNYKFALLTLTVPNVSADDLPKTVNKLLSDFHLYMKYKDIKSVVCGFFRSLEITYNQKSDTYHPHIHAIIALPKSYGSKLYLSHAKWLDLWKKACKNDSITQLNIQMIKPTDTKSFVQNLAEVAKYSVKSADFLYKKKELPNGKFVVTDEPLPDKIAMQVLKTFSLSLYGVRVYGSGGCWKKALAEIKADDFNSDKIDLVHISDDKKLDPALPWLITIYRWREDGYRETEIYIEMPEEHAVNQKKTE